jgi:hypothetical protein
MTGRVSIRSSATPASSRRTDPRITETALLAAGDGERIAYYIDDFIDPWREAPVMLLLHSAMGSSQRSCS